MPTHQLDTRFAPLTSSKLSRTMAFLEDFNFSRFDGEFSPTCPAARTLAAIDVKRLHANINHALSTPFPSLSHPTTSSSPNHHHFHNDNDNAEIRLRHDILTHLRAISDAVSEIQTKGYNVDELKEDLADLKGLVKHGLTPDYERFVRDCNLLALPPLMSSPKSDLLLSAPPPPSCPRTPRPRANTTPTSPSPLSLGTRFNPHGMMHVPELITDTTFLRVPSNSHRSKREQQQQPPRVHGSPAPRPFTPSSSPSSGIVETITRVIVPPSPKTKSPGSSHSNDQENVRPNLTLSPAAPHPQDTPFPSSIYRVSSSTRPVLQPIPLTHTQQIFRDSPLSPPPSGNVEKDKRTRRSSLPLHRHPLLGYVPAAALTAPQCPPSPAPPPSSNATSRRHSVSQTTQRQSTHRISDAKQATPLPSLPMAQRTMYTGSAASHPHQPHIQTDCHVQSRPSHHRTSTSQSYAR